MPSKYTLYPSTYRTNTLSYQDRELDQVPSSFSGHSLYVEGEEFEYRPHGRGVDVPASAPNGSLMEFDIDTSEFMNMNSPFPWDDKQSVYPYTDPHRPVQCFSKSSISTVQDSYCSKPSPPCSHNERFARPKHSRESVLIPDFPRNLAYHHIQACESRPANLRAPSGDSETLINSIHRNSPSYKRSITTSQLDSLAGALGVKCGGWTHTPQRPLQSNYMQERPTTPPLSFSSTTDSSPVSSTISPHSQPEDLSATVAANTSCITVLSKEKAKSRASSRSSGPGTVGSGPKQIQHKISGPLPNLEYPSMANLTMSPFSAEIYNSDEAFQHCRKTPNLPSSITLPPGPGTSITPVEPPSWFDLDDDTNGHSPKQCTLPIKLGIPHLRLGVDSSSFKKRTPVPAFPIKRRSEDSITTAANVVNTIYSDKSCTANKMATTHFSFSLSPPTSVQTKVQQATLQKNSSVNSKLLVAALSYSTETLNRKKSKKVKVVSSSKNKKRSPRRRFRAWIRKVFG